MGCGKGRRRASGKQEAGEERRRITREEVEGNGAVIGQYRFRRLYEYELDLAAQKNMLTLDEALLLCALAQCSACYSARRLGEIAGVGQPRLFLAMQKLERKKLIAPEKPVKEKSAKEKPADRIESTAEKKKSARRTKRKKAAKRKKKNRLLLTEEGRKLSGETAARGKKTSTASAWKVFRTRNRSRWKS